MGGGGGYNSSITPQNSEVNRSNSQDNSNFEQNVDFSKNVKISKKTGHLEQPDFCNSKLVKLVNKSKKNKLLYVGLFCLMILLYVGILCAITTPINTQTNIITQADLADGATGSCGSGVTYEFKITDTTNNLGTLTISGSGAMRDYTSLMDGHSPFYNCTNIKTLNIGSGVTSIGNEAFRGCSGLTSINIPTSVTRIGGHSFRNCSSLTKMSIPDSVMSIGDQAFNGCSGLTEINIPNSVTSISVWTFNDCSGLTEINIPDSVTSIGDGAFSGCSGLTSLTIPNSVTNIGGYAFSSCSGLTEINIPDSVTSIGDGIIVKCANIERVVVGKGNTKYSSDNCNAIIEANSTLIAGCKKTSIPNNVKTIAINAFGGCSELTKIDIPNSVTSIGNMAFSLCSGLTSVIIPKSVTSIGSSAFEKCSGLINITISSSVTSIGEAAFWGCSRLISIVIPKNVRSIGDSAFYYCSGLKSVKILGNMNIADSAFAYCSDFTIFDANYAQSDPTTTSTAYTYAKRNKIKYGYNLRHGDYGHNYDYIDFKNDSTGGTVKTNIHEDHTFIDKICNICGERDVIRITLNVSVTTNNREFVIYVLDSTNKPTRQFVVGNNGTSPITFDVDRNDTFTIQVYETLYMQSTIDTESTLKKTYSDVTSNTEINITITGVMNVNNWIVI